MAGRHQRFLTATLAAGVALGAFSMGIAQAQTGGTPTNPGFNAKDKINPGGTLQAPSGAPPGSNDASGSGAAVANRAPPVDSTSITNQPIPNTAEVRAALLSVDSGDPAIGQVATAPPTSNGANAPNASSSSSGDPAAQSQGHAAIGGPLSPGAGKDGGSAPSSGQPGTNETTGKQTAEEKAAAEAGKQTSPSLPIGSTTQTQPAKFSKRNDVIDRVPAMALPYRLTNEQLRQIYQAAMGDKDANAIDDAGLNPATQLTATQADAMRDLPTGLGSGSQLKGLKYIKSKERILLVEPSTRIVMDEIRG